MGVKRAALCHYLDQRRKMPVDVMMRVAAELGYELRVTMVTKRKA